MQLKGYAYSNLGLKRNNNEDNYYLFGAYREDVNENIKRTAMTAPNLQAVAAVCDGMGGEAYGELASLIAVKELAPVMFDSVENASLGQINIANKKICEEMEARGGERIGSTVAAIYFDGDKAVSCNVGDSRCYMVRDRQLFKLSKDHSEGQRLIDMGMATEEDAKTNKSWHRLTQHLGIFEDEFAIEPYYSQPVNVNIGDRFFICSDGVTDLMSDQEIAVILVKNASIEDAAENMVQEALNRGGKDNTTVVIVDAVEGPSPAPIAVSAAPVVTPTVQITEQPVQNISQDEVGKTVKLQQNEPVQNVVQAPNVAQPVPTPHPANTSYQQSYMQSQPKKGSAGLVVLMIIFMILTLVFAVLFFTKKSSSGKDVIAKLEAENEALYIENEILYENIDDLESQLEEIEAQIDSEGQDESDVQDDNTDSFAYEYDELKAEYDEILDKYNTIIEIVRKDVSAEDILFELREILHLEQPEDDNNFNNNDSTGNYIDHDTSPIGEH